MWRFCDLTAGWLRYASLHKGQGDRRRENARTGIDGLGVAWLECHTTKKSGLQVVEHRKAVIQRVLPPCDSRCCREEE